MSRFSFIVVLFGCLMSCSTSQSIVNCKLPLCVENKKFSIDVNSASPLRGQTIFLNSPYSFKMRNDSVFVHLPYFGFAQGARLSTEETAFRFSQKIDNYRLKLAPKNCNTEMYFTVKDGRFFYKFFLTIQPGGSASINIISPDRDAIRFDGNLDCDM